MLVTQVGKQFNLSPKKLLHFQLISWCQLELVYQKGIEQLAHYYDYETAVGPKILSHAQLYTRNI